MITQTFVDIIALGPPARRSGTSYEDEKNGKLILREKESHKYTAKKRIRSWPILHGHFLQTDAPAPDHSFSLHLSHAPLPVEAWKEPGAQGVQEPFSTLNVPFPHGGQSWKALSSRICLQKRNRSKQKAVRR